MLAHPQPPRLKTLKSIPYFKTIFENDLGEVETL